MGFCRRSLARLSGIVAVLAVTTISAAAPAVQNAAMFKDDRTMGSPTAPVIIIEYAAPVCPHCAHFAETVLPKLKKSYIDTGKVLYVLRIFPLSQLDGAVAGMAKCAGPKRYFEFVDLAFRKQAVWNPEEKTNPDVRAGLVELGRLGGLDPKKVDQCMTDEVELERIDRIAADGEKSYGVTGVPTVVINGTVLEPSEASWPELRTRIDKLLTGKK